MAVRRIDQIVKLGAHPLENHFDISDRSTEMVVPNRDTILERYEAYDKKDNEIERDYQLIMDKSLEMVDRLTEHIDGGAEAKFLARLAEVAGQQLNIALSAIEKKSKLKSDKDKLLLNEKRANQTAGRDNTLVVMMDRNEMLNRILSSQNIIDGEHEDITGKEDI